MIFGTGTVNKIYDEVVAQGLPTASKDEQKAEAAKQGNWFQRISVWFKTFSFHCSFGDVCSVQHQNSYTYTVVFRYSD